MRDPETGNSRGFGFISYDSFEASDSAIEVCFSLVFKSFVEILCEVNLPFFCYTHAVIQHLRIIN